MELKPKNLKKFKKEWKKPTLFILNLKKTKHIGETGNDGDYVGS